VRLHHKIALSGTRCSSCKPVVLVTLRGCHLLDGLVACNSVEAHKKLVQCFEGGFCEGYCSRPVGVTKSNSSKSCH
jgi:Na+-translocating ferredoxin:NAD+ oxidoreductase RnfC subunit